MSKMLCEQKVLKKLGIDDFRHLPKDKVVTLALMLDEMEPEVAKKALEQFPDFSNTMREVFGAYRAVLEKSLEVDKESVFSYYATCDAIITSCQKELEKDALTFEQRQQILACMIEVANMKGIKDVEEKKFIQTLCALGLTALSITATVLLTVLGGNIKIDMRKI